MTEPTTEAGKRLLAELDEVREDYYPLDDYPDAANIAAIEAEARAAALRELREEVEGLDEAVYLSKTPEGMIDWEWRGITKRQVLGLIDRRLGNG
jgi:hypothetical protein